MIWGGADVIIEVKWTVTVMCLNHPETIPPTGVCGKTDFHKFGPWNQNQPFWSGRYAYWRKRNKGEKIPGFLTAVLVKCSCPSLLSYPSCVQLFAAPWTVVCQALLSMGFSKQAYWSGLPCPPPWDLPDPGIELMSSALQANSLLLSYRGRPTLNFLRYPGSDPYNRAHYIKLAGVSF